MLKWKLQKDAVTIVTFMLSSPDSIISSIIQFLILTCRGFLQGFMVTWWSKAALWNLRRAHSNAHTNIHTPSHTQTHIQNKSEHISTCLNLCFIFCCINKTAHKLIPKGLLWRRKSIIWVQWIRGWGTLSRKHSWTSTLLWTNCWGTLSLSQQRKCQERMGTIVQVRFGFLYFKHLSVLSRASF